MEFNFISAAGWIFAIAAVFFAAIVRGFSGFGFSALSVALLSFVFSPMAAVPAVMTLEVAASAFLLPGVWRQVDIKWLIPVCIGIAFGTPFGVWLLSSLDEDAARILVYGMLSVLAAAHCLRAGKTLSAPPLIVGVFAGAANGLAAVAGLAAALFLLASARSAAVARASLIALFFVSDIYALLWGGGFGLLRPMHGVLFAAFILPLLVGVFVGGRLFAGGGERHYRKLSAALILLASGIGLLRLFWTGE